VKPLWSSHPQQLLVSHRRATGALTAPLDLVASPSDLVVAESSPLDPVITESLPLDVTKDVMRSLLFQASLLAYYWAESLNAATYLLNLIPTKAISAPSPHFALFDTTLSYAHLRFFGCTCYPNFSATAPHKLAPRSCWCIFPA
jgi:hypothetical protein